MKLNISDTIAAISTPPGEGGIGIVRISGSDAESIVNRIFRARGGHTHFESQHLYYGTVFDSTGDVPIDECLMVVMRGPRSFTGEDIVEFHCHGGQLVIKKVLEAVLRQGARLAEAGEFTKRAFLNGKVDLVQAEAIIDMIRAKTDLALAAAHDQLQGRFSTKLNSIKVRLVDLLSMIEAELDFPDEEGVGIVTTSEIEATLRDIKGDIFEVLSTYEEGKVIRDGIRVIILGRPNVGKSTLLNILLKEERAIVTPIPGTTRDVIEEVLNLKGLPISLMDTAGLRDTVDTVETIGLRLARERLESAQLVLYTVDATSYSDDDMGFLSGIRDKKVIVVVNKADLVKEDEIKEACDFFKQWRVIWMSAIKETGIDRLEEAIFEEATGHSYLSEVGREITVTNVRHKAALDGAYESIGRALNTTAKGLSGEFLALELREAVERLGEITGEVTTEDILGRIFNQFCVGK
ncbi:MAG: tRNA uridine-5-carboxymethylaminomethyl(34) synthesis GTPase MnmE [Thermodesulfobacteriota bacterium]